MTLHLTVPVHTHTDFTPRITVIGVGGGGTNAVDNMIASGLTGVDFVVANTDAQQLQHSKADRRIQLGPHLTQGLGAGAKPEIGRAAAQEAADELMRHLDGTHMVFITAGMGGGTGTGAAPVIAQLARERGVLTVGVVTKPFTFEGARRTKAAEQGITELQQYVDTLIVIPNQNLFRLANERTGWKEAFKMADQVLYMGVRGVTDLMMAPGLVNLDFADIRTVMAEMGKAMMGTGEAEGENRAIRAAEAAISNPLLEDTSMAGARGLLINITGGEDMTLFEVDQAANRIREEVAEDANIIFGSAVDESLSGRVRVSVVATGIDIASQVEAQRPRLVAMGGGGAGLANAISTQSASSAPGIGLTPSSQGATAFQPSQASPAPLVTLRPSPVEQQYSEAPAPQPAPQAAQQPARSYAPPAPAPRPATAPRQSTIFSEPRDQGAAPPAPMASPSPARSLFGIMTRGMRGVRGALTEQTPAQTQRSEPQRADPSFPEQDGSNHATVHAQHPTDEALEIPAFLRRQTS
jgi:cell division protein FtsZ